MKFGVKSIFPEKQAISCVIVSVFEKNVLSTAAKRLDKASNGFISNILKKGDIGGKVGETLLLYNVPNILAERLLLVGCGKESELNEKKYVDINKKTILKINNTGITEAISFLTECKVKKYDISWKIKQAVLVSSDILYNFDVYKSKKDLNKHALKSLFFNIPNNRDIKKAERALVQGINIAKSVKYMKDLANTPPNICTPTYIAKEANKLAKKYTKVTTSIINKKDMQKLGMNTILAVASGSNQPPKLITIKYAGDKPKNKPLVLVGKGITFDSGGLSLKPRNSMVCMKYDMCGAATVLGLIVFAAEMKLPLNIVGIIPAVENMPGSKAYRPDDIVKSLSGITIEILNTDAEGRLILCDALTYSERFNPKIVIDVATLTGACIIALGRNYTGLFSNHEPLANNLIKAGNYIVDKCWQLPITNEYQEKLNSAFADIANVGGPEAGSITAACFLSRFTKKYHWAHLDIAGTNRDKINGKEMATGRPIPLLAQYLLNQCY